MKNRGLLVKLLLLVGMSVAVCCAVGLFGIQSNNKIFESVGKVSETADQFQRGAQRITDPLTKLRQLTLTMVMAPNIELQKDISVQQRMVTAELDETFESWDLADSSPAERDAFEQLRGSWRDYREIKDATVDKVLQGYREEAFINAIQSESQQFQVVNDRLRSWQTAMIDNADAVREDAKNISANASWVFSMAIVMATLLIGGFGIITIRMIIGPIETLKNTAARIASRTSVATLGEALDERIDVFSEDELGTLAQSFNQMVENLRNAMEHLDVAEKRTQAILNSTADGILTIDDKGKIRSLNASAQRLLKYPASEINGQNITSIIPHFKQNGRRAKESLRAGESRRVGGQSDAFGVDKQGRHVPIELRVTEMEFSGERLYIATLQDIAQRQQDEQERNKFLSVIRETVNHLSIASGQISATMKQQSVGSEKQVSAVTDTIHSVDEASRATHESMKLANEVAESARRADDVGKSGRRAIEETRVSMTTVRARVESTAESILLLAERAQAIGEIIATVNEIADQSNLLALNAAIEASRAGEAGKGFAVVAAEFKSLAQQAQKSTAEVRVILNEIQQATNAAVLATEQGTESVGDANEVVVKAEQTIEELGSMVSEAAQAAARIVAASNQQVTSMSQITDAMSEIDRTAKQTLVATRQTTSAAEDLNDLGSRLNDLMADEAPHET
ncbi:MAG: PAS domain S-box protein [Pirellulaceae bacterium]|nr:PAS domain S-box protein [Pirellulaceae bacterium]